MKKFLLFIVCLFTFSFVNAEVFKLKDTDMSVELDTKYWAVVTKDNLNEMKNKDSLTEEEKANLETIFSDGATHIYAVCGDEKGNVYDFFVNSEKIDSIVNLNNIKDNDLNDVLGDIIGQLPEGYEVSKTGIYKNDYTYIYAIYKMNGMIINYYVTVINGTMYRSYLRYDENNTNPYLDMEGNILNSITYNEKNSIFDDFKYKAANVVINILEGDIKTIAIVALPIILIIVVIVKIARSKKEDKKFQKVNNEFWS